MHPRGAVEKIIGMRAKTVLLIVLAVNVLWAAAFAGYARRLRTAPAAQPAAVAVSNNLETVRGPVPASNAPATSLAPVLPAALSNESAAPVMPVVARPSAYQYGWRDITNASYAEYLMRLRAAGCPEKQIRAITINDANDLFDRKRLENAIKTDPRWWKSETFLGVIPLQAPNTPDFDGERRELLGKLLGDEWNVGLRLASQNAAPVNLSGPVLGALPAETWQTVQEICARSAERYQEYINAHPEAMSGDNLELARLREGTRAELAKTLTPQQLEEFLIRFSQNSARLRQDFAGLEVTPDEFRRIFRVVDPLEHRMQVEYGSLDVLSPKQRAQLEQMRDGAVKEALSAEHFAQYMGSKDPLYKQSQLLAGQSGLNTQAIQPLYDLQKSLERRKNEINADQKLSPEERTRALQSLVSENQQRMQQILTDARYRQ